MQLTVVVDEFDEHIVGEVTKGTPAATAPLFSLASSQGLIECHCARPTKHVLDFL